MINFTISERDIVAHNDANDLTATRNNTLRHPRFVFGNVDESIKIMGALIKEVTPGFKLLKPCVKVTVKLALAGGPTEFDNLIIKDVFDHLSRKVLIEWQ